jgi:threonine synthase
VLNFCRFVSPIPTLPAQICASCGHQLLLTDPQTVCPRCGGLLEIVHPLAQLDGTALRRSFDERAAASLTQTLAARRSGVWRYNEILGRTPEDKLVSFPEGNTPLLDRPSVASYAGLPGLLMKHEGMNPTGSFKDRGMCVAVTQARATGASAVACASTGNTSSSLACYAGIAGIPALVLVPSGKVAAGKLAQTMAYGARTLMVRGDFDDCMRLAREASEKLGVYLANSVNPFRIEGQKTIILELLQQLQWTSPDWITVPAGNLGNASAFGKAIREALALGLIQRAPRLLLVQAAGAAPFARSYEDGFANRHTVKAETVASAIRIGDPASYDRAVLAVQQTNGMVVDVTDAEILEAKSIIDRSGVGCEPASAASVAGAKKLAARGVIAKNDMVVAILTGHVLKDPVVDGDRMPAQATSAETRLPVEIDANLSAIEAVLRD